MQTIDHVDHDLRSGPLPIPVTILTGFLGAGKTTLLNRILNGNHGLKVAVLVNDFGAINIDAELVVGVESNVISLANGCVCCTIRDDLIATVMETINRPERPEYILLEASGVAEPSGIAMTFNSPAFRDHIRLDSILCVVDAEQVFAAPEFMELKIFQMAWADMVILNKVDLVDREQIGRIKDWLDSRFHRYRLIEAIVGITGQVDGTCQSRTLAPLPPARAAWRTNPPSFSRTDTWRKLVWQESREKPLRERRR
jgi:G3E family GTPase